MHKNGIKLNQRVRIIVGLSIIATIALIHIIGVRNYLKGDLYVIYCSYASDLIIPFGIYFLLCISELRHRILKKWYVKASIIIGLTTLAEILQLLGIYALGKTFDPIDIIVYVLGVGIAVIFDRLVFKQFISFWDLEKMNRKIQE